MNETIEAIKNIINPTVKYSISGNGVANISQSSLKRSERFKKNMETFKATTARRNKLLENRKLSRER